MDFGENLIRGNILRLTMMVAGACCGSDAVEASGRYSAGEALAGCGVDEAVGATCNGAGSLGEALDGSGVGNTH